MPSTPTKIITMDTEDSWLCSSSYSDGSYAEDDSLYDEKSFSDCDSFEDFGHQDDFEFNFEDDDETENQEYCAEVPFWFGSEESDQLLGIIKEYDKALKLETKRQSCIRAPKPFVGQILRRHLTADTFQTFDEISLYHRIETPPGKVLTPYKVKYAKVEWDAQTGLPTNISILNKNVRDSWLERSRDALSYIYCLPSRVEMDGFYCFNSKRKLCVHYSNDQPIHEHLANAIEELCRKHEQLQHGDNSILSVSPPLKR